MKYLFLAVLGLAMNPVFSEDLVFKNSGSQAVLLELYTSEGCSSCPPAEEWLSSLSSSPELWRSIFPLSFHVDYWDNLGWRDRFAKSAYTDRQRAYASRLGQDSVYTPEVISSGREWKNWFRGNYPAPPVSATSGELTIQILQNENGIRADYHPSSGSTSPDYTINVATLGMNLVSNVVHGENAGRVLRHNFVVLDLGTRTFSANTVAPTGPLLEPSGTTPVSAVVAWVTDPKGSILQIAGGRLPQADSR